MIGDLMLFGSLAAYGGAAVGFGTLGRRRDPTLAYVPVFFFVAALALTSFVILERWSVAGRPPFKTLFESLLLFVWCTSVLYLALARSRVLPFLGAGVSALLTLAIAYALLRRDLEVVNLPPALQSPWFIPHVATYFVAYGAFAIAGVAAGVYLTRPTWTVRLQTPRGPRELPYSELMHYAVLFGLPVMTVGLVLGAIWAKEAWGDYWSWDPKENWALASWLIFGAYLHARRLRGWAGRPAAWLVVIGCFTILFTYLFMSVLPTSEASAHVYQ